MFSLKIKRYYLNLPFLESTDSLALDQEVFVRDDSPIYLEILEKEFQTELRNQTNAAILVEYTDFARVKMTLSNYFYKDEAFFIKFDSQLIFLIFILNDVAQ